MIEEIVFVLVWLLGGLWRLRERMAMSRLEPLRRVYLAIYYLYLRKYGSFIAHNAKFSTLPCFPHGYHGVFIGGGTKIGSNCVIFQHVTIGANAIPFSKTTGVPTIGDNCYIGAGAVILGAVTIGNNCRIGANCTVASDVPENSVVVPSPARVITRDSPLDNRYYRWSLRGPEYFKDGRWILETDRAIINNIRSAL